MNISSPTIHPDGGVFQYIEVRDFQRRISELQRANLNLKMVLIERENQMSRAMVDGKIDREVITEYIQTSKQNEELSSQLRNVTAELEESQNTVSDLKRQLDDCKNTEEQLKSEISGLKAKNQIYENRDITESPGSSRKITSLKLEMSKLKQDIATQEARNAELMVDKLNLQSKLNDYENDEKRNDSEISRIRRLLTNSQTDLLESKAENDQLKAEIEALHQQISEKSEKIERKSKKIRSLKRTFLNNSKDINNYTAMLQKRAQTFQTRFDDITKVFTQRSTTSHNQINKIKDKTMSTFTSTIETLKRQSQHTILQHSEIVQSLLSLCAKVSNIPASSLPEIDDLLNDQATLELFVGRVQASVEMQRAASQSDISRLEMQAKQASQQQKSALSTTVARFMTNLQGSMNEMTKTLHQDHIQLIDALTITDGSALTFD